MPAGNAKKKRRTEISAQQVLLDSQVGGWQHLTLIYAQTRLDFGSIGGSMGRRELFMQYSGLGDAMAGCIRTHQQI